MTFGSVVHLVHLHYLVYLHILRIGACMDWSLVPGFACHDFFCLVEFLCVRKVIYLYRVNLK